MNAEQPGEKALILMVDDGPENIQLLGRLLQAQGFALAAAASGTEALAFLQRKRPDLILLDVMMPMMDGFEVCRRLRQMPGMERVPVLFLSARSDQESINKGLELGGDDYVTKPFHTRELVARVRHHIERDQALRALAAKEQEHTELLHVLSHDLANPLGTIVSFAELIEQDAGLSHDLVPKINRLAQGGLELIDLIRRMRYLDEKGIQLEAIDLKEVVAELADSYRMQLEDKQVRLEVSGLEESLMVTAEPSSLLHSVLGNLLTNAIKFSHPGGVIHIEASRPAGGPQLLVVDQGVGMSEKLLGDLFDMTKRTSRQGTAGEMGTGFGMPLVKKFMEAYDGSLKVTSRPQEECPEDHGTAAQLRFCVP